MVRRQWARGRTFWFCFLAVLAVALVYPVFADSV